MNRSLRLLSLMADGEWHYGLDLCRTCRISRAWIYILLNRLEDSGIIESRPTPTPIVSNDWIGRPQWRSRLIWRLE